jgi:hypothetical protein
MNVEDEPAPFIIHRQRKVLLILDHLSKTAGEPTLLTAPDEILQRPPFSRHSALLTARGL